MFFGSCVSHAFASVHCCLVVTCWERADLLALVFPMWYPGSGVVLDLLPPFLMWLRNNKKKNDCATLIWRSEEVELNTCYSPRLRGVSWLVTYTQQIKKRTT